MDAAVICQQIRDTFTYPLMLRLLVCKGFPREALLPFKSATLPLDTVIMTVLLIG